MKKAKRAASKATNTATPPTTGANATACLGRTQRCLAALSSVLLLTLAAAPYGQLYLAWFALVPWLNAVSQFPKLRSAFFFGWLTGIAYFGLNEWWLWTATVPGTIGVIVCSGFYWGLAALLIRFCRLVSRVEFDDSPLAGPSVQKRIIIGTFAIAGVWIVTEWLRCKTVSEFPWLPIGSTQSPMLVMCQAADFAGVWIVSFWLVLVNAFVAHAWLYRRTATAILPGAVLVTIILLELAIYGVWRIRTTPQVPGPVVMLLQSNHPHLPGGASTTTPDQAAKFFLSELERRLSEVQADLVVLPENEFPPLNEEARAELAHSSVGRSLDGIFDRLNEIAEEHTTALLVGGAAVTGWSTHGKEHIGAEIRNSAYLFDPYSDKLQRYDKVRLVPYSERLPFAKGPAWLRAATLYLAANRALQPLHAGKLEELVPFGLTYAPPPSSVLGGIAPRGETQVSFIAPICLENVDPILIARMLRDPATHEKRAAFIANLSNDGWFADQEKRQHLQLLVFRCIENRVSMARCSNTGASAFIDSTGRVQQVLALNQVDGAARRLNLDERTTLYMRYPDALPLACVSVVAIAIVHRLLAALRVSSRA